MREVGVEKVADSRGELDYVGVRVPGGKKKIDELQANKPDSCWSVAVCFVYTGLPTPG
jgi:hypothetical protein